MSSRVNSDATGRIRRCRDDERAVILEIINTAAQASGGVIPADRWHDTQPDEKREGERR